jgi:hypothetical protein
MATRRPPKRDDPNNQRETGLSNPPSIWWPEDRAWCVGTDIDLMTTYVGGSQAAIDALLADEQLEASAVSDDQPVTWDADTVNPLPDPP